MSCRNRILLGILLLKVNRIKIVIYILQFLQRIFQEFLFVISAEIPGMILLKKSFWDRTRSFFRDASCRFVGNSSSSSLRQSSLSSFCFLRNFYLDSTDYFIYFFFSIYFLDYLFLCPVLCFFPGVMCGIFRHCF